MLKIAAAVFMLADHIGAVFGPSLISDECWVVLRCIGRLSMPIFAFLISEGCRYTRDRKKYFLFMFLLGAVCDAAFYIAMQSVYFCILTPFSLSVLLIYTYDEFLNQIKSEEKTFKKITGAAYAAVKFLLIIALCLFLLDLCERYDGVFDYRMPGIMLPLLCYIFKNRWLRLILFTAGIAWSVFTYPYATQIPYFAFLAVPIVALYNGERGKLNLKYFFYLFYPVHLLLLEGIYMLIMLLR